jgi:hypothetical protein
MTKKHMEDPKDWKFKRNRNGDEHINNCSDGYCSPKGDEPRSLEIHHILCVHACSDATFPERITDDEVKLIYACLAITDWNINASDNNIGLPTKWAYVRYPNGNGWDGLPCHQVDHDLYLKDVQTYVRDEIWKEIRKNKKKKACEEFTGQNIAEYFNTGSDEWKTFLKARGNLYGGTKACLEYCTSGEPRPGINDDNWHIPFSMAPNEAEARKRAKPPSGKVLERLGLLKKLIA